MTRRVTLMSLNSCQRNCAATRHHNKQTASPFTRPFRNKTKGTYNHNPHIDRKENKTWKQIFVATDIHKTLSARDLARFPPFVPTMLQSEPSQTWLLSHCDFHFHSLSAIGLDRWCLPRGAVFWVMVNKEIHIVDMNSLPSAALSNRNDIARFRHVL